MKNVAASLAALTLLAGCFSGLRTAHAPTEIPWASAERLVLDGQVVELEPRADGTVRLHLVDGRHLVATEPADGEALRLVERCGEKCAQMNVR